MVPKSNNMNPQMAKITVTHHKATDTFFFLRMLERQHYRERVRNGEDGDPPSTCSFSRWLQLPGLGLSGAKSQEPGASFRSPMWVQGPTFWAILCCLSRHNSKEMDSKLNIWDSNWNPHGMLPSQVAALPAIL